MHKKGLYTARMKAITRSLRTPSRSPPPYFPFQVSESLRNAANLKKSSFENHSKNKSHFACNCNLFRLQTFKIPKLYWTPGI